MYRDAHIYVLCFKIPIISNRAVTYVTHLWCGAQVALLHRFAIKTIYAILKI